MATKQGLRVGAAAVWLIGAGVLLAKASALLLAAWRLRPGAGAAVAALVVAGISAGLIKSRLLFVPSCDRNLRRIEALREPRWWQLYRLRFFAALALMIDSPVRTPLQRSSPPAPRRRHAAVAPA